MKKNWEKIAEDQFKALDSDMQAEWSDLHDRIAKR